MYFPSYLYIVQRNAIITASQFLFWTYPRPHCCLAAPQYWHKTHCHWALSCCDWPTELRWQNAVLWLDWACLGCQRAPPPAAPASESAAPPPAAALQSTQDTQHSATQWPQAISTGAQCVEQCPLNPIQMYDINQSTLNGRLGNGKWMTCQMYACYVS